MFSGTAPSISTFSFIIVLGTPVTLYFSARCGNSIASIMSAVINGFSMANWWASLTALGQYGHVGVTNTCIYTGLFTVARKAFVVGES